MFPELFNCSLKYKGVMWKTFKRLHDPELSEIGHQPRICLCYSRHGFLLGWGLSEDIEMIFDWNTKNSHAGLSRSIMLYVRPQWRRHKIGTELFRRLAKGVKRASVTIYSDSSNRAFFNKVFPTWAC